MKWFPLADSQQSVLYRGFEEDEKEISLHKVGVTTQEQCNSLQCHLSNQQLDRSGN